MTRRLMAFALLAAIAFGAGMPTQASAASPAGIARDAASQASAPVEQVQYRERDRDRHWRGGRHWDDRRHWRPREHRRHWRPAPPPRSGFYLQFGTPPRYAPPPRYRPRYATRLPVAHVRWCENRYRSYRASDNSFQPYHGPRQACISPYI